MIRHLLAALSGVALTACSEGGNEDRPMSEVQISAAHRVVGLIGPTSITDFPIDADVGVGPLDSRLVMSDDSRYLWTSGASTLVDDDYALENDGELTLLQSIPNAATRLFRGGYGLEPSTGRLFVTDRVTSRVGLYFGVPLIEGSPDLASFAGSWHVFSAQLRFADPNALPSIHEVGRAFSGSATIMADGTISGSGTESSLDPLAVLPISGAIRAFQDGAFSTDINFGTRLRQFVGGGDAGLIIGSSTNLTANEGTGICALMRERTTPIDLNALAGTYSIGIWTLFLNPGDAGFDALFGTLELTAAQNFRIDVRNNFGDDLLYEGDFTATDNGALGLDVVRPAESWAGAVDEDNATIIIVDSAAVAAAGARTAIRFMIAIRRKPV